MRISLIVLILYFKNEFTLSKSRFISYNKNIKEPVRFFAIGDWGGSLWSDNIKFPFSTKNQRKLAKTMQNIADKNKVDFVLSLGDNIYPCGVESATDFRFDQSFKQVYQKGSMENIPWFLIAGNHDHCKNNAHYQIEHSTFSDIWNFPDFYYSLNINLSNKTKHMKIKFLMIDTTLLCNLNEFEQNFDKFDSLNRKHLKDLDYEIKNSNADYIFLVGHHPVFSSMSVRPTSKCLYDNLFQLIKKYSIKAYISGHDHTLQSIIYKNFDYHEKRNMKFNFFISGAGESMYDFERMEKNQSFITEYYLSKQGKNTSGFVEFALFMDYYTTYYKDKNGFTIFQKSIKYFD